MATKLLTDDTLEDASQYPTLSFDAHFLFYDSIHSLKFQSPKQQALTYMSDVGSMAFVEPKVAFETCLKSGLVQSTVSEPRQQQEELFTVALNNNLISLLCQYINERRTQDTEVSIYYLPNPKVVLDWGWNTFQTFQKQLAEKYCILNYRIVLGFFS